jgi:aspartate-semialdehyde dehydrogenase
VAILGATGLVGRRLAELILQHEWFSIEMLVGSRESAGKPYEEVWNTKEALLADHYGRHFWRTRPFPQQLRGRTVSSFEELLDSRVDLVFSSIPERSGGLEQTLLDNGYMVFSNSPYRRFDPDVALIVPEANGATMQGHQLIKNPNCVTSGLSIILTAIDTHYGLREISVTTYQSLSGRGDAKYPVDLVLNNVFSLHKSAENTESYIAMEIKKILQTTTPISVSCSRVDVQEGHYVDVRLKTNTAIPSGQEASDLLREFNPLQKLNLPTSPAVPLVVLSEPGRPRPREDAWHYNGMAIAVGNISTDDEVYDLRLTYVVNNVVRGAAGGAILNAEYYYTSQGFYHQDTKTRRLGDLVSSW